MDRVRVDDVLVDERGIAQTERIVGQLLIRLVVGRHPTSVAGTSRSPRATSPAEELRRRETRSGRGRSLFTTRVGLSRGDHLHDNHARLLDSSIRATSRGGNASTAERVSARRTPSPERPCARRSRPRPVVVGLPHRVHPCADVESPHSEARTGGTLRNGSPHSASQRPPAARHPCASSRGPGTAWPARRGGGRDARGCLHRRFLISRARSVEPTMSVNTKVRTIRPVRELAGPGGGMSTRGLRDHTYSLWIPRIAPQQHQPVGQIDSRTRGSTSSIGSSQSRSHLPMESPFTITYSRHGSRAAVCGGGTATWE
jgi:hypothetical protein